MAITSTFTRTMALGDGGSTPNVAMNKQIVEQYTGSSFLYNPSQLVGVNAPSAPTCTPGTGGSMVAGNYLVKITYANAPQGESLPSAESTSQTVASSGTLIVTSPAISSPATHYNVYITAAGGSTGTETKQNSSPIPIGTNYVQSAAVSSGAALPGSNTTLVWAPTLPATVQVAYIHNLGGGHLNVQWTRTGGSSQNVIDLVSGADISFSEPSAGAGLGGITALTLTPDAVQTSVDLLLVF